MNDEFDWMQFEDVPDNEFDFTQFEDVPTAEQELPLAEQLYRTLGVHGLNRGFAKIFGFGPHQQATQQAYEQAKETHPLATEFGNIGSQVISSIPFAMATGATPGAGALYNIGRAALGGALSGAIETPYDEETRLGNMFQNALSSAAFPALGYGLKGGYQTAKTLKNSGLPISFSKEKIAKGITEKYTGNKTEHGKLYESLFDEAKKLGAKTNLKSKAANQALANKSIDKKLEGVDKIARSAVKKAYETNEPAKVKEARTALSDFIRDQKRLKGSGNSYNRDAYREASKMHKDLGVELNKALEDIGLGKRYKDLNTSFRKEVKPYEKIPALYEHQSGDLTSKDFVKALQGNAKSGKRFRANLAETHPEVRRNQLINDFINYSLKASGIGGGAYGAYEFFK